MKIIPIIGSRGFFTFAPPISTIALSGVEYTCQAVRRISEYTASNEDPKEIAYTPYGVENTIYEEDVAENAYIVSLQSAKGHWLYVPYRFILNYPSGDGVVYRSAMLVFSLPSFPREQDISGTIDDIKDLILGQTGMTSEVKIVETSLPSLISNDAHVGKQTTRNSAKTRNSTYGEVHRLTQLVSKLTVENAILSTHIKNNG